MIKKICFLLLIFSSLHTNAQDSLSVDIKNWFNQGFDSYIDIASGFYYEECSYLGVFGKNNYKFNIRFDTVRQQDETQNYYVEGRSLLHDKIVSFKGELKVEHLDLYFIKPLSLAVSGSYYFVEENGGVFKGVFRKYMSDKSRGQGDPVFGNIDGEVSYKEGFAGVWVDPKNDKKYRCLFGFYRYPEILADDFDTKGGEPHIHPKYKSFGWDIFFQKQEGHGIYINVECNYDWWK